MKVRTIVICSAVTACAAAGIGFGAYYAMQGRQNPVEVVPVANVNTGSWSMPETIYGSVTSQVAQRVVLDEEYPVAEIYVEEGDEVTEGTPLFSYDMTLAELELEMEQLTLQTQEISLTKLEKELEKLKNGDISDLTASLMPGEFTLTAASDEELVIETYDEALPEDAGADSTDDHETIPDGENIGVQETEARLQDTEALGRGEESADSTDSQELSGGTEASDAGGQDAADTLSGFEIEEIESVDEPSAYSSGETGQDSEGSSVIDLVTGYEELVAAIDGLFSAYGDELKADEVGGAIETAVKYFRQHLADKQMWTPDEIRAWKAENGRTEEPDAGEAGETGAAEPGASGDAEDGSGQLPVYVVSDAVRAALSEEEVQVLETSSRKMNAYHVRYVEMMISEASALSGEELAQAVDEIKNQYDQLDGTVKEDVSNAGEIAALEERASQSESESESEAESESESESEFQSELESEAQNTMAVSDAVRAFATAVDTIFLEGASPTPEQYRTAIDLYQQYLGVPVADVADLETSAKMEEYVLSTETGIWLASQQEYTAEELQQQYKSLCLAYVRFMVTRMDPKALVRDDLTAASEAYAMLGVTWTNELEAAWQTEQAEAQASADGTDADAAAAATVTENGQAAQSNAQASQTYPSLYDMLAAYNVILLIQEVDTTQAQDVVYEQLSALWDAYSALTDMQKSLVWNMDDAMIQLLREYGLWQDSQTESDTETYTEPGWDDGYLDDYMDDEPDYTAEELQEMIEEKEREIKDCKLEIRETELSVKKQQRIVDGKVVKSTIDGVVASIGTADGDSDDDYFVKVTNQTGLYAKGVMNELALEKISVGDTISGVSDVNGMSFTAVIKEISEYPDSEGASMSYGDENTNASYYPFYALIDDPDGMEEGDAEIQLSEALTSMDDEIYLENYYVRKDSSGKPYVYVQGEDKKLKKQYVTTGKSAYGYAIEIVSGLELTDRIAFPYGDDVVEGAETKEVDMLEATYG